MPTPRHLRGFTLIEVMVALGILLVALVGMLHMQIIGITSNAGARMHTQASELAQELAQGLERLQSSDARVQPTDGVGVTPPSSFGPLVSPTGAITTANTLAWDDATPRPRRSSELRYPDRLRAPLEGLGLCPHGQRPGRSPDRRLGHLARARPHPSPGTPRLYPAPSNGRPRLGRPHESVNAMRTRTLRGFTLIELLIAAAVSSIVISGVFMAVSAQQRAYYDGHRQRAAQAASRDALLSLERIVSLAGYGMDGPLAFDFTSAITSALCPTQMAGCPRDSIDNPDELIVLSRDPAYWTPAAFTTQPQGHAWLITALDTNTVTVTARAGDQFLMGQILQAVCRGGGIYAYFTVSTTTPAIAAGGPLTIQLATAADTDPFRQQGWATNAAYSTLNSCFVNGQARLFLVHRYRFHIRPVPAGNGIVPYLMLDPGVDTDLSGSLDANDETVLAEGIESFQVAYVMNNTALALRGMTPGSVIGFVPAMTAAATQSANDITTLVFPGTATGAPPTNASVYDPSSFYSHSVGPPAATARLSDHQANIVAVRIGIVARSSDPEPDQSAGELPQLLFNMNGQPSWISATEKYARTRIEVTIPVRNTYVRGMNDF